MIVLPLDPGLTTGWAVLGYDGRLLVSGVLKPDEIDPFLSSLLLSYKRQGHDILVVVEKMPQAHAGKLADQLRAVILTIDSVLIRLRINPVRVAPGVWKTSSARESESFAGDRRLTSHERDAIRMGRYALKRRDKYT